MGDALTNASHFKCKVVVVMHIWEGYPPYRNFLKGGHLPSFCHNITLINIEFKASSPAPAFTGIRNFSSCIFDIHEEKFLMPVKAGAGELALNSMLINVML